MKKLKTMFGLVLMLALSFIVEKNTGINPVVTFSVLAIGGALTRAGMKYEQGVALFIIDPSDLSFHGKEAEDIGEAIYEATFKKPKLQDIHRLMTGIKAKKQIPILGRLGLVGKVKGDCDTTPNPGSIPMSEKFWDPVYVSDRFKECWATLKGTFFQWGLKNGIEKEDLTDTDFALFLEERIGDAMWEMLIRIAHFGDTAEATVADSGNITDGIDAEYFTGKDGMWPQLIDIATADTDRRVTIANNAEANYADQRFDATDTTNRVATNIFQNLVDNADTRLIEDGTGVILATRSLCKQYAKELKAASGIPAAWQATQSGLKYLEIDGVMIIEMSIWDTFINAYFNTGTKWYLPHRAVFTTKENIPVGTEEEKNLSEIKPFYSMETKNYYVDFGVNLDIVVLEGYKCQIAY